ncbi:hypothetical protein OGAPHI_005873 [Ogataea philodendri]|uniref:Elongator complex protein 2 n=1 Tax=Ogataea philodendri TaxID=1378263 RepID=A0A9P8P0F8_9ASCO|nr:uncharacterized protein OGAPHI_005873 [Ogataea philodendri]KAH3662621.1 hypothetical protein OGAPHI_005873 [Ogataea philodendri]
MTIFVGCNKELQICDYSPVHKLVAYGARNAIALWSPEQVHLGVLSTLKAHSSHVVAVKWLPESSFLVSTAEDHSVKVWKYTNRESGFDLVASLDAHSASVTSLAVSKNIFVTGGADGKIKVWAVSGQGEVVCVAETTIGPDFMPLSLAIEEIEPEKYVIFVGGSKPQFHVLSYTKTDSLQYQANLPGHEDWIKSIAVKNQGNGEFLVASGSQDRYIRLWKLCVNEAISKADNSNKLGLLMNKQHLFSIDSTTKCSVNFDAIIMGHDDWISSLVWHPTKTVLLSSSADTSIMLWEPDQGSGVWISSVRLGEMSIKGASTATGASGGFWSTLWIFNGNTETIITNGKTGSFRCWTGSSTPAFQYNQVPCLTGPMKEVTDVCWARSGKYLLATSLDQTTRLFAKWTKTNTWHEFSRPQIHGYDMICVKPITDSRFISGGDEKIMRSFDEPKAVASMLEKLCGIAPNDVNSMPESASLPVLGLSNKAEAETEVQQDSEDESETADNGALTANLSAKLLSELQAPPMEDILQRHTLWPEIEKLYGHGFEITTLDVSPDGKLIASACRSNVASHAVIRLFRTDSWLQITPSLAGHDLTITRLRFSPNGGYLVSVSRDRKYSLWKRHGDTYELVELREKAHSRIIWDVCWLPETEHGIFFVTGSRDRRVQVWRIGDNDKVESAGSLKFSSPVTALDCYKQTVDGVSLVAVGMENGEILICSVDNNGQAEIVQQFDKSTVPDDKVTRLSWNPTMHQDESLSLAVGSSDCSVRIYTVSTRR